MKSATASSSRTARCASKARSAPRSTSFKSIDRRQALIGGLCAGGALALGPSLAVAAEGRRVFEAVRGRSTIGEHVISAHRRPDGALEVEIEIELVVRVLGIPAYRYEHSNREVWRDGGLESLSATTNDDGDQEYCRIARVASGLEIDGSSHSGVIAEPAAPTSYWNYANLDVGLWISTQSGKPLKVRFSRGREDGLERIDVSGDFETTLFYDAAREWRGNAFEGGGKTISYRETVSGPEFNALLAAA